MKNSTAIIQVLNTGPRTGIMPSLEFHAKKFLACGTTSKYHAEWSN